MERGSKLADSDAAESILAASGGAAIGVVLRAKPNRSAMADLPLSTGNSAKHPATATEWTATPKGSKAEAQFDITKIERAIDLRKLRYFVNIVAERSFSIAAMRVRVAQPALSHHVQELEAALGVPLLTRSAHGVFPTEAGKCLYEHSLTILDRIHDAAVEVSAFNQSSHSGVTVGLHSAAAAVLAPPLFEVAQLLAPELQLTIEEGSDIDMMRSMRSKRLNIALLYDVPRDGSFVQQPLLTEALELVGPAGSGTGEISFRELAALPLILPKRSSGLRNWLDREARLSEVELKVVMDVESVSSIKKMIGAGLGYSVLSAAEVSDETRMGLLQSRTIVAPELRQTLSLCHLRGDQLSPPVEKFRRLALQIVGDLIGRSMWPGVETELVQPRVVHG